MWYLARDEWFSGGYNYSKECALINDDGLFSDLHTLYGFLDLRFI